MIISTVIADFLIVFSAQGSIIRLFFSDWTVNLSAAAAFAVSGLATWNSYRVNKIIDDRNERKKINTIVIILIMMRKLLLIFIPTLLLL